MAIENILKHVDHTLLAVTAISAEYINFATASIILLSQTPGRFSMAFFAWIIRKIKKLSE
jgi:hypothetical protein